MNKLSIFLITGLAIIYMCSYATNKGSDYVVMQDGAKYNYKIETTIDSDGSKKTTDSSFTKLALNCNASHTDCTYLNTPDHINEDVTIDNGNVYMYNFGTKNKNLILPNDIKLGKVWYNKHYIDKNDKRTARHEITKMYEQYKVGTKMYYSCIEVTTTLPDDSYAMKNMFCKGTGLVKSDLDVTAKKEKQDITLQSTDGMVKE